MKDAKDAKVLVELGGVEFDYEALSDNGDHKTYKVATAGRLFSMVGDQKPLIRPGGVLTGLEVTPDDAEVNNTVDINAGTAWINGALVTLAAATEGLAVRGTAPNIFKIDSITLTDAAAIAAAAIKASEIFKVPNQHRELASYPTYVVQPVGEAPYAGTARVVFSEALPLIHTGPLTKTVYARYTNPNFVTLPECSEIKLPRDTFSQTEEKTYDGPRAAVSLGRGSGGFSCLHDGTGTALIMQVKGTQRFLKFFPDKYLTGYWICLATLAIADEYPAGGSMKAAVSLGSQAEPEWIQP